MYREHINLPPAFQHKLLDLLIEAQQAGTLPDMLGFAIDYVISHCGTTTVLNAVGAAMDAKRQATFYTPQEAVAALSGCCTLNEVRRRHHNH